MKLTLTVTGAQGATLGASAQIVFTNCGGTIGRDEARDWVLAHPLVSRLHAIIRYADGVFTIEDRSTNGTRRVADATRLASGVPESIHDGDVLVIGPYTVTVQVEAEVVEGETAAPVDDSTSTRIAADSRFSELSPPRARLDFEVETYEAGIDSTAAASPESVEPRAPAAASYTPPAPLIPEDYDPLQDLPAAAEPARDASPDDSAGDLASDPFAAHERMRTDSAASPRSPQATLTTASKPADQTRSQGPPPRPSSIPPPASAPSARSTRGLAAAEDGDRNRYTVWFGTNRRLDAAGDRIAFTAERDNRVRYGWCRVNIPQSHKIGSVGSAWWKRLITRTDDRLTIARTELLDEESFWQQIAAGLASTPIADRDAVVFVHGFNVSFEEASLRAAQLGFDLGVNGLMAFYSWPSQGTLKGYPSDEAAIEASEGYIADFLTDVATRSGAARVHVIAHSMGNRALLRAIDRIAADAAARSQTPFDQIILAAPDVDQDTFKRLSIAYQRVARRTTLYVCAKDRAVEASHWIHGYARAGLVPPVTIVPGVDTINVSNLDLTLLGHGYVAEARELLTDIHELLRHGTPPDRRFGLRAASSAEGVYWLVGG